MRVAVFFFKTTFTLDSLNEPYVTEEAEAWVLIEHKAQISSFIQNNLFGS
jgi:hypothetical protein